jgi:hypothetical protein
MSSATSILPVSVATSRRLWSMAYSCCSARRITSEAVLTRVLKAKASSGLGFFLSRPMVHGPTSAGSDSPSRYMATAQPSSSSFLITCAVQPLSRHRRASLMASGSPSMSVLMFSVMAAIVRARRGKRYRHGT